MLDRTQLGTTLKPSPHAQTSHVGTVEPRRRSVCVGNLKHPGPAHKTPVGPESIVLATTCPLVPSMPLGDPLQTRSHCEPRQVLGRTPVRIAEPLSSGQQSLSRWGAAFCGPLSPLVNTRTERQGGLRPGPGADFHPALWASHAGKESVNDTLALCPHMLLVGSKDLCPG